MIVPATSSVGFLNSLVITERTVLTTTRSSKTASSYPSLISTSKSSTATTSVPPTIKPSNIDSKSKIKIVIRVTVSQNISAPEFIAKMMEKLLALYNAASAKTRRRRQLEEEFGGNHQFGEFHRRFARAAQTKFVQVNNNFLFSLQVVQNS